MDYASAVLLTKLTLPSVASVTEVNARSVTFSVLWAVFHTNTVSATYDDDEHRAEKKQIARSANFLAL
jgi:hypothetical protein